MNDLKQGRMRSERPGYHLYNILLYVYTYIYKSIFCYSLILQFCVYTVFMCVCVFRVMIFVVVKNNKIKAITKAR